MIPRTRGDCVDGPRPCPHVACRYHVYQDMRAPRLGSGAPTPTESCALDVADRGPTTLEVVGEILGVTRERVRQIEVKAMRKMRKRGAWVE